MTETQYIKHFPTSAQQSPKTNFFTQTCSNIAEKIRNTVENVFKHLSNSLFLNNNTEVKQIVITTKETEVGVEAIKTEEPIVPALVSESIDLQEIDKILAIKNLVHLAFVGAASYNTHPAILVSLGLAWLIKDIHADIKLFLSLPKDASWLRKAMSIPILSAEILSLNPWVGHIVNATNFYNLAQNSIPKLVAAGKAFKTEPTKAMGVAAVHLFNLGSGIHTAQATAKFHQQRIYRNYNQSGYGHSNSYKPSEDSYASQYETADPKDVLKNAPYCNETHPYSSYVPSYCKKAAYSILGISNQETANEKECRKAYHNISRTAHPDKGGSNEAMYYVNQAKAICDKAAEKR